MTDSLDILGTVHFGHEDAVESRLNDRSQVLQRKAAVEGVDPDEEVPVPLCLRREQGSDVRACIRLLGRSHGVLEIEDQHVCASAACFSELAFTVAGHEQKRAQPHVDFRIMSATRRQWHISSLR